MKTIELTLQSRTAAGKSASRRARREGTIPAVVYGNDVKPQSVAIGAVELKKLSATIGQNVLINLKVDGELNGKTVRVRDFQVDPLKHTLIHTDFITVDMNKPIEVEVEVELVGKPAGLIKGGILTHGRREITIRCLPKEIPEKIEADVSGLDLNEALHVADVKLPGNIKAVYRENYTLATVHAPAAEVVTTPAAEAAPAEGAAAAPAAAGAKGAPGAAAAPAGGKAPAGGGKK